MQRGDGEVQRRATKAAAACGSGVWLLSPQLPGGAYDELINIGGGGDEHGAEALKMVFLPETLCPDINFMSAILGQNTKYVFHHKIIYVFVSSCFWECSIMVRYRTLRDEWFGSGQIVCLD